MESKLDTSQQEWNLSPLLKSLDDPAAKPDLESVRSAHEAFAAKWRNREDCLTDSDALRSALDDYEALNAEFAVSGASGLYGKAGYYFWLRERQDNADTKVAAKRQQAVDAANEIQDLTRFFELSLGKIDTKNQQSFLADSNLADYRHFLEKIFAEASHQLSEVEEKILSLKSATSHKKWVELTEKAIASQERTVELADGSQELKSFEQLMTLLSDEDKSVRDRAAIAFNDVLSQTRAVAEAEMNAVLANHKVNDQLRGFSRPDEARFLADDIEPAAVDTMIDVVTARENIAHRFYRLKAELLKLPTLAYHERNVPYGDLTQSYPWDEACQIVNEVYSELDPEFGEIFRDHVNNGSFDVFPRKGKHGGAFCVGFTKVTPSYVLLNHTDKLKDVITLAHEFGHALNNELMRRRQNSLNFDVPLSTAEVASQYLEDFFFDRLIADADDETQLAINVTRLNDAVSSISRQVACCRFERNLHKEFREKGYLSADEIGELFQKEMASYMGPAVEQSPGAENWWIYWGHIRRFFYNYSYASGLLIAKAMQHATRQDRAFIGKVKEFLSTGTSLSPKEIFAKMDIDITDKAFWNAGLDEIETLLEETERLARKLGKISG